MKNIGGSSGTGGPSGVMAQTDLFRRPWPIAVLSSGQRRSNRGFNERELARLAGVLKPLETHRWQHARTRPLRTIKRPRVWFRSPQTLRLHRRYPQRPRSMHDRSVGQNVHSTKFGNWTTGDPTRRQLQSQLRSLAAAISALAPAGKGVCKLR